MLSRILDFIKTNSRKDWFCLLFVGLAAFLITLPIAFSGVPDGNDLAQHLRFAKVFHEAISSGDFFPGWAGGENMGFGSIGIRYYPPVAYYLMAFTQFLTGSWAQTFWLNSFFWMFLGGAGVYLWAKEWLSPWPAFFAAALYAAVPYHSAQIYQYLLYAEYAASGILPFCFLFATRIIRRGKFIDVLLFSAAFSLLLLTHIPLTIIGSIGLAIYALLLTDWKQPKKTIINFIIAGALSLSATAFHWLRAVSEVSWVNHNSPQYYANGYYDYNKYFFPMFYSANEKYGEKILWHLDVTIIFSILLLLPLIIYLVLQFKSDDKTGTANRKIYFTMAAAGIFSIFILSLPSAFIWNSFTLLQKTQFPWRWLALASIFSAAGFTTGIGLLISNYERLKKPVIYAASLLFVSILLFDVSQNIIPAAFMPEKKFEAKVADLNEKPECVCWWTIWAKPEAFKRREKVFADSRAVDISRWDAERREFTIEPGAAGSARVASFFHPHWKAESGGAPVEVQKADDGTIVIPVGAEKTSVKLYFQEPLKLKLALAVSLLTWLFLVGAAFIITYRSQRKTRSGLLAID